MRVVLDTNVFISGLKFGGGPATVLQMAADAAFVLIVSDDILLEIEDVLIRKFKWTTKNVNSVLQGFRALAEVVEPDIAIFDCEDPDDNRILEAAIAGRADSIVSGGQHLFRMKKFRGIEIVMVQAFLEQFER